MDTMIEKLKVVKQRYDEINDLMVQDVVISNPKEITKLAKEQASIKQLVDAYEKYEVLHKAIEDARVLVEDSDPEIKEMGKLELASASAEMDTLMEQVQILLIPKEPNDDHDVIMEIRGGAGGDEGNIFAGDLYRMYTRYAESKGWKVQVLEASESEAGGFTQIIFSIKGNDVYRELKFESGAHRVQRVPKTETQGRIHTSTATVLCQPEAEDEDIEISMQDLTIETHRASGAGGQHVNKTDSAVRIVHVPTGITVNCQDGRSQIENRETALRLIKTKVLEEYQRIKDEEAGIERRAKIGTGDRSEKIRTYNYPQNRVTDHRIGLTITQLDRIVEGKLNDIIEGLLKEEQRQKLESE